MAPILGKPTPNERTVFAALLQPLADICKPPLTKAQVDTYFGLLRDLSFQAIQAAVAEIAGKREYPTWPMPGEIRKVAMELMRPDDGHGEAFRLALSAAKKMVHSQRDGYRIYKLGKVFSEQEWNQHVLSGVPPLVAEAMKQFGWTRITNDPTVFAQFRDVYKVVAMRGQAESSKLPAVKALVEATKRIGCER